MVIWCIGMYASASTWLFNVTRRMLEPGVKLHFLSGPAAAAAFAEGGPAHLVKSHEISDAATVELLARRAAKMLITIRDPRDAVTSLMLYHGYGFEDALGYVDQAARLCRRFANDPRALVWRYESEFFDRPETLQDLAGHLGLAVPAAERQRIFAAMRRAEVEKHIADLPLLPGVLQDRVSGDRLDPRTHWHTHHAGRSGEMGRWKHMLTQAQAAAVEAKLGGCFNFV